MPPSRGGVGGSGRGVVPNNATVGIGKSGFTSADEFTAEAFTRYQRYTDEAYSRVLLLDKKGKLVIPEGMAKDTIVGQKVDSIARARMRAWLKSEGISEGPSELIQLNRWLRDQAGSGSYRIPDVRIPDGNLIMDGTIGLKWWDTPQIKDFYKYSGGNNITIVRPTERGGSYSILPQ